MDTSLKILASYFGISHSFSANTPTHAVTHRRAVDFDALPRRPFIVLSHKAQHTREPEAVVSVSVRDEDLGYPSWLDGTLLDLVMKP